MQRWDAKTYDRFEAERARPSRDLIARIPLGKPKRILDLGCGSGLSTLALRKAYPKSDIVGVDLSPDMLTAAAKRVPRARFLEGDAATFDAHGFDLVFANALFHWVPGHVEVIARLGAGLPAGGALALQMPDNQEEPSHRLMREIAALPAFRGKSDGCAREKLRSFAEYDAALSPPCDWVDIWRTTYVQRVGSPEISSIGWKGRGCDLISIRSTPSPAPLIWRSIERRWRRPTRGNGAALSCLRFRVCSSSPRALRVNESLAPAPLGFRQPFGTKPCAKSSPLSPSSSRFSRAPRRRTKAR